jgi:hypothetical protein
MTSSSALGPDKSRYRISEKHMSGLHRYFIASLLRMCHSRKVPFL